MAVIFLRLFFALPQNNTEIYPPINPFVMAYLPHTDEKELLHGLQSGDYAAFDAFYALYSDRIYGKLLRFIKVPAHAEEMLQDVFMKVWEKRENIDPDKPFKAYLFRIAEHLISDFYRRAVKDQRLYAHLLHSASVAVHGMEDEDEGELYEQQWAQLNEAIAQLPPKARAVYVLCKIEGKSYQEVSEQLGISTATISNHITKANQLIRTYLQGPATALLILHYCFS